MNLFDDSMYDFSLDGSLNEMNLDQQNMFDFAIPNETSDVSDPMSTCFVA